MSKEAWHEYFKRCDRERRAEKRRKVQLTAEEKTEKQYYEILKHGPKFAKVDYPSYRPDDKGKKGTLYRAYSGHFESNKKKH